MGLFVGINSEGREIEPRRQLSFASERPSTRETKNKLETKTRKGAPANDNWHTSALARWIYLEKTYMTTAQEPSIYIY